MRADFADPNRAGRGALRRSILLCALLVVAEGFALPGIGLTAASLMGELGLGKSQFGLSVTVLMAGFFVGALGGGLLGDRYGHRRTVIVSFLAVGGFSALGAATSDFTVLLISRAAMGLGLGAALPTLLTVAANQVPEQFRGRAIAIVTGGGAVGGLLASVMVGVGGEAITWRIGLWTMASISVVFLPFFALFTPKAAPPHVDAPPRPAAWQVLAGGGRLPTTLLLAAANFLLSFNMNGIGSWAPALLRANGLSQQMIGLAAGLVGPSAMLASFAYATLFDRGRRKTAVAIAVIGTAPALLLFFLAKSPAAAVLAMSAIGLTVVAGALLLYAIVPVCYPPEGGATGMGASMAASRLGAVAAPLALGLALEAGIPPLGLLGIMLPVAALALLSALMTLSRQTLTTSSTKALAAP